ncbi:MAG: rhomboid family intramembrane serine protease [archaeon]
MKFYAIYLGLIAIIVFIMQTLIPGFTEMFVLNQLSYTEIWRFVVAIFLHGDLAHLLLNLFGLVFFGLILEKFVGGRNFLIIFFLSGVLANIFAVNFYSSSLGASGAIFGIIGALTVIRPGMPVWAFSVPMPLILAAVIWAVGDVMGAFGFGQQGIGNFAHLSGLVVGLIFGAYFRGWGVERKGKKVEVPEEAVRVWEDRYMLR